MSGGKASRLSWRGGNRALLNGSGVPYYLIGQVESQLGQAMSQDYAQEFLASLKREMKASRNDSAIQAFKANLLKSGG